MRERTASQAPLEQVEPRLEQVVADIVERVGGGRARVIPLLQAIQARFRYLDPAALELLYQTTEATPAAVAAVATFYSQFRLEPMGEHLVAVCHGTACHVAGAQALTDALYRHLGIPAGSDTDPERRFTLTKVACVGCCSLAPVLVIDGTTYGHATGESACRALAEHAAGRAGNPTAATQGAQMVRDAARGEELEIRIGLNSCCMASGSLAVQQAIEAEAARLGRRVTVKPVGCVGMCHRVPLVEVAPDGGACRLYADLDPYAAGRVVQAHLAPRGPLARLRSGLQRALDLLVSDRAWEPPARHALDGDDAAKTFLEGQVRLVTEGSGRLGPLDLEAYIRSGGYEALRRCQAGLAPDAVIDAIRASGLRGRGGAGYPTGDKWAAARVSSGDLKYVICNGDEGDPGAFMDRMILESFPHRVLEGLAIAAHAIGACRGFLYIRAEYPLAVSRMRAAIEQAKGLLDGIRLEVVEGAGAFVCGEETGLIASLEGRRGMPRPRPPYPSERGLHGRPTLINNVETLAAVPWILRHGPEAFAALGTSQSKGTKVFALAGRIRRVGMIEVPMGMTLRRIVDEIGGGVPEGRTLKAVQVGGPSGGCVPAVLADTPVDFEALSALGAIMGSGGLVVLDDRDCMVDVARYFLSFTQDQSCGRCTFCRIGTRRMLAILERLCSGQGKSNDLEELERLALAVKRSSLCGLGSTAPNPMLTTLSYFREEYEEHLAGRCRAGSCKALIAYVIDERCHGCALCARHCPVQAIAPRPHRLHEIDQEKCIRCGGCLAVCPAGAVARRSPRA